MAMSLGSNKGVSASINMTPMIDVLLVLIIIFMVIQSVPTGLEASIPQPSPDGPATPERALVIQVDASGALRINQDVVDAQALAARLGEILKLRADKTCFVKAAASLDFQDVARIIDIAKSAGASRVGLM